MSSVWVEASEKPRAGGTTRAPSSCAPCLYHVHEAVSQILSPIGGSFWTAAMRPPCVNAGANASTPFQSAPVCMHCSCALPTCGPGMQLPASWTKRHLGGFPSGSTSAVPAPSAPLTLGGSAAAAPSAASAAAAAFAAAGEVRGYTCVWGHTCAWLPPYSAPCLQLPGVGSNHGFSRPRFEFAASALAANQVLWLPRKCLPAAPLPTVSPSESSLEFLGWLVPPPQGTAPAVLPCLGRSVPPQASPCPHAEPTCGPEARLPASWAKRDPGGFPSGSASAAPAPSTPLTLGGSAAAAPSAASAAATTSTTAGEVRGHTCVWGCMCARLPLHSAPCPKLIL
ncbi:uncharacterized protein LOC112549363 [Alligator sinensis]|uniref:Uncharacterized protein LOC112549363 n=1 Tax=Alligator sinensis TaxID=38654 RepID=A0A3Q0G1P6_ALLSI|nr:uncharacterized protein LOC112549363 [Alligator sinensis]